MVPTVAKPAASYLSGGVAVTVLSFVVLLASAYFGIVHPGDEYDSGPSLPLAWCGWIGLALGVALLSVGVLRLAQHADRDAGVRYHPAVVPGGTAGESEG